MKNGYIKEGIFTKYNIHTNQLKTGVMIDFRRRNVSCIYFQMGEGGYMSIFGTLFNMGTVSVTIALGNIHRV